jgi:hypothetical protein
VRRMLAGVEARLDETGGLVQGRIDVALVPTTDLDGRFAELLARFQARDTPSSPTDLSSPPPDPMPPS